MTIETVKKMGLTHLKPTPMVLELVDRSTIMPEGILDEFVVSVESWQYPMDSLVLQPKSLLGDIHSFWKNHGWLLQMHILVVYEDL